MTYKFITREEIDGTALSRAYTNDLAQMADIAEIAYRLLAERDEALKRCAAYREAGLKLLKDECEDEYGPWDKENIAQALIELDAEAARLMEKK